MDFEEVFKKENIGLVFDRTDDPCTFIAETGDMFSDLLDRDEFGREWAWAFPSGRYVITVYQRYAVYENGQEIWLNHRFENVTGPDSRYREPRFAVVLDQPMDYYIASWDRSLTSHFVRDDEFPLQVKTFGSGGARAAAASHSGNGSKAAILEWYEDFDMF